MNRFQHVCSDCRGLMSGNAGHPALSKVQRNDFGTTYVCDQCETQWRLTAPEGWIFEGNGDQTSESDTLPLSTVPPSHEENLHQ